MPVVLDVVAGLAGGFVLACLGYLKNMSSSRVLKEGAEQPDGSDVAVVIATRN